MNQKKLIKLQNDFVFTLSRKIDDKYHNVILFVKHVVSKRFCMIRFVQQSLLSSPSLATCQLRSI